MLTATIACALTVVPVCQMDYETSTEMHAHSANLSRQERDRIFNTAQFAIKKMYICLDDADREASRITDVDIRQTTKSIVQGAICGLGGRTPHSVILGGCLGALSHVGGEAYEHFMRCRDHVYDAKYYAHEADRLQEILWMDGDDW